MAYSYENAEKMDALNLSAQQRAGGRCLGSAYTSENSGKTVLCSGR